MSYTTYIENFQIFGNNDYYPEWFEFLQSQGIEIDDEKCYDGYITDFMGAIAAVEKIVMRLEKEHREKYNNSSLFNFGETYDEIIQQEEDDRFKQSLFDKNMTFIHSAYMFIPYALFDACSNKLEADKAWAIEGHCYCYKAIEPIHVHAS